METPIPTMATADRWGRLASRVDRMSRVERLLVGCAVTLCAYATIVWWAADIDASSHPTFRAGWFEAGYAFMCVCTGAWVAITAWLLAIRKRRTSHAGLFYAAGMLYVASNTLFAFGIGWDTSPWIPLTFFAAGVGGFVWMDTPGPTWASIIVGHVIVIAGITAEALGWLPHAFVLAASPNAGGAVDPWWHLLVGAQTLVVSGVLFLIVRYVSLLWRLRDREVRERNELLRHMFGRYMSTEVMRALLDNPEEALGLGGQQREVTLLMSDLRGFTSIAERLTPAETIGLLNDYFEVMVEVCLEYQGTINEIIGDALLVVFGAPAKMADHADRAIACALAMQRAMDAVNARNRAADRPEIEMGIGLNTGEVVVGNIGSTKRTKYGVVGSQVNRTARIESYTVGGQVLAARSVLDATRGRLTLGGTFEAHPKGGEAIRISVIRGIAGTYDVAQPETDDTMAPLDAPLTLHYAILTGKHDGPARHEGLIVELGARRAMLVAAPAPALFDNLAVTLPGLPGETLYAKVIGDGASGARVVHFTSAPPAVQAFLRRQRSGAAAKGPTSPGRQP